MPPIEHLKSPLNLEYILDNSCYTPEDFEEYHKYLEKESVAKEKNEDHSSAEYTGYRRYILKTDCMTFVIVARKRRNGTYEIKGLHEIDRV